MYIPGRLRTARVPSRTVIALASYAGESGGGRCGAGVVGSDCVRAGRPRCSFVTHGSRPSAGSCAGVKVQLLNILTVGADQTCPLTGREGHFLAQRKASCPDTSPGSGGGPSWRFPNSPDHPGRQQSAVHQRSLVVREPHLRDRDLHATGRHVDLIGEGIRVGPVCSSDARPGPLSPPGPATARSPPWAVPAGAPLAGAPGRPGRRCGARRPWHSLLGAPVRVGRLRARGACLAGSTPTPCHALLTAVCVSASTVLAAAMVSAAKVAKSQSAFDVAGQHVVPDLADRLPGVAAQLERSQHEGTVGDPGVDVDATVVGRGLDEVVHAPAGVLAQPRVVVGRAGVVHVPERPALDAGASRSAPINQSAAAADWWPRAA